MVRIAVKLVSLAGFVMALVVAPTVIPAFAAGGGGGGGGEEQAASARAEISPAALSDQRVETRRM